MSEPWEEDSNPWTVKSATRPYANDWFHLDQYEVIHPHGAPGTYTVIRAKRHAVGVLPLDDEGNVHLVGQWRFPLGRYSWEMPEGGADPGEDTLDCAKRELEEETGLSASAYVRILEMDMSNSLCDEVATIYLATGLTPGFARPERTEVLRNRTASFAELMQRVVDGRIRDSMTVAAVLRAHHMAVTGQLPEALARAMLGR